MEVRDKEMIDSYRASHPECRWCIHNLLGARGRSSCRVKDVELRRNSGVAGKIRARVCPCYSIK